MSEIKENTFVKHLNRELDIMRKTVVEDDSLIIEPYVDAIHVLCESFSKENHSGGAASMAAGVIASTIKAILGFQILSPLTGEEDEWNDITEMNDGNKLWQNNRDSAVFKDIDGKCYYVNSIVWKGNEPWDTFTGSMKGYRSANYIKSFPFMPRTFYIDVYREDYDKNNPEHSENDVISADPKDVIYFIKDSKQLDEVFKYYNKREI
tara:strand:- start:1693 stop:2313 length:621 start_codon:yes stop_codon:yes gene_type:complete